MVVYFLPRKMATSGFDFIEGAIAKEEYNKSTCFLEPLSFARSERRCVRAIKSSRGQSLEETRMLLK